MYSQLHISHLCIIHTYVQCSYINTNCCAPPANWDGFQDLQSGLFSFQWWVGMELGHHDAILPTDPHMSLMGGQSSWTNRGIALDQNLDDGSYYISVQVWCVCECVVCV